METREFERTVEVCTEPKAIWSNIIRYFGARGINRIGYRHFPPLGAPDADVLRLHAEGYPEGTIERYISEQLYAVDPNVRYGREVGEPFYWDEVPEFTPETDRDFALLEMMKEVDRGNGVSVPVFGPYARNGLFGLSLPHDVNRLELEVIREYQWVSQLAHIRYCTLLSRTLTPRPELSPRETQVLTWVAHGKSNSAIGEILGISGHTVEAHLRRIYLKLGVFDRITATVRGLGVGLIHSDP